MFKFLFDSNSPDVQKLSSSSYQLFLPSQIQASKLVVSHISIPYTFYNVNDNNNRISINNTVMYLKEGNYTSTKLLLEFKNLIKKWSLDVNGITLNDDVLKECKYDTDTYKFNFLLSNYADEINIKFLTCDTLFGAINKDVVYTLNSINNVVMDYVADLNSVSAIMIRSNLQSNYLLNGKRTNILFRMPIDKPLGSILTYNNTDTDIYTPINNINNFFIQLTDDTTGEEINLNGGEIRIEFICF